MDFLVRAARRYPLVAATLLVGVLGLVLWASGQPTAARLALSAYTLVVAAMQLRGMVEDIRTGHWGIDILAVTAIVSTVMVGEHWAALVIVLMLTGGEALEDYAAGRSRRELTALLARAPQTAHLVSPDGTVSDVPIGEVEVGIELLIKPGELVPVDATLLSELASLDESSLTGESLPVERMAGDPLLSGAVNGPAAVHARATARAEDSQYSRIVALVQEAAGSRAPFVRLADRVAIPFTLTAFAIAGIAWAISGDPVRFAEVLVVATPCPLLIATPVAFMAGMGRSAKNGIIVKNGGTLERLARIRTAVFDKTGTLTHGTPEISRLLPADGVGATELLVLAASAEQYSPHALAKSVVAGAHSRGLALHAGQDVTETTAQGVSGLIGGQRVVVGKADFVAENGPGLVPVELEGGELAVYVAVRGAYAGAVVLRDRLRDDARSTIERLVALGVRDTLMLTGDAQVTAERVAAQVGILHVRANCLPADKVDAVHAAAQRPVMMVGDGVNDAPVLATADVGVAMGAKGSTAASESADVVILLDDLSRTARAIEIAQRTMYRAWQSIWIGVVMSVGLMVLAAFGLIPAIVGAGLQEVVDLATILNALRAASPGRGERTHEGAPAERRLQPVS